LWVKDRTQNLRSYSVGRDAAADIPIADTSVSRLHAVIGDLGDGRLSVTDRGSSNGTFVVRDGVARGIQSEQVSETDTVRFGTVEIAVADLLAILHARTSPTPVATPLARSVRLVRCACGAVKPAGGTCPFCNS
jgi:pSer/pThr/pTyr-binding forkhead associated (FHA) protein